MTAVSPSLTDAQHPLAHSLGLQQGRLPLGTVPLHLECDALGHFELPVGVLFQNLPFNNAFVTVDDHELELYLLSLVTLHLRSI